VQNKKKIYLLSLGCPKNLVDSEHLLAGLRGGIAETADPAEADVLVVNTCGFIEEAKKESIEEILRLSRLKEEGGKKKLLVVGCLSQRYGAELKKELPEVDALWGVNAQEEIAAYLGIKKSVNGTLPRPSTFPYAYLKIAEGCKRRCTFCSIPAIRGPHRSFGPEEILKEANAYIKTGIKELILVSQDTACYDFKGYALPELLADICSIDGDFRVRVHYLHPSAVSEKLIETMAREEKITKYLDIPLQHSEERLLRMMGRGNTANLARFVARLRRAIPGVALRSSFIVGFPGETEEEFRALCDFLEEGAFEHAGAFLYSREEGTQAATLKGQLPKAIKKRRYDELMKIQARISLEKNMSLLGQEKRILIDSADGEVAIGRMGSQSPDIDGVVFVREASLKAGDFADVLIKEAYDYDLAAETL